MKVRFRHTRLGKVRFLGHRDVARIWERSLRKAELAVAYSEGFSPRPKVAFGLALPTGAESTAEYVDADLLDVPGETLSAEEISERLRATFPLGIDVLACETVDKGGPSLQEDVVACEWTITLRGISVERARESVERVLASPTLMFTRERKGERSVDNVRPGIERLCVVHDGGVVLQATLATKPRGIRPSELLAVCQSVGDSPSASQFDVTWDARLLRTAQLIERDGARRELISLHATSVQERTPIDERFDERPGPQSGSIGA